MKKDYKQLERILQTTVVWLAEAEYSENLVAELAETGEMYIESTECKNNLEYLYKKAEILQCLPITTVYLILKEMIFKQIFLCRFMMDKSCCTGLDQEIEAEELDKLIKDTQFVFGETLRRWNGTKSKLYNDELPSLPTIELLK